MSKYYHNYIVTAMDMLIGDPDVLTPTENAKKKADYLCIPYQFIDRLGNWRKEHSTRGEAATRLIHSIGEMLVYLNNHSDTDAFTCKNKMKIKFFDAVSNSDSSVENAIALAKQLQREGNSNVAIMTGSDWMTAKASAAKIDVAKINPEVYTGRTKVRLPEDAISLWTRQHHISQAEWEDLFPKHPIHFNEFVEFEMTNFGQPHRGGYSSIGRFTYDNSGNPAVVPLCYTKFYSPSYKGIRPITNVQAMYMEALLAPVDEIPIVIFSGLFGTGKTFLPIAVGLNGVDYHTSKSNLNIERIFVCPRDSALGQDVGFLPGDITSKVMAKAMPVLDNVRDVIKILNDTPKDAYPVDKEDIRKLVDEIVDSDSDEEENGNAENAVKSRRKKTRKKTKPTSGTTSFSINSAVTDVINRYFEFQPLIFMGGRSISNSLIIYDEFQDVERFQARELVSRIGNGSKIVIAGDPTQLSNPHLGRTSNGLNYIATKLADKPYAAVITSNNEDEIVRHWVLREVAKALGN